MQKPFNGKEVYRIGDKTYRMLPLLEGEACYSVWGHTSYYQDKNGRLRKLTASEVLYRIKDWIPKKK